MALLGMGNPLLDMSGHVDSSMLSKYDLKANDAILYEKEDIFEDLKKACPKVEYSAGGATQNSMRVAQWIMGESAKGAVTYMGCIGKDETGKILESKAREAGVEVRYFVHDNLPTGKCAVLITGLERSLVTKLDAANCYLKTHLEGNWELVEKADVCYSSGFFLTVSAESMLKVAKHAAENNKIYAMNLSAPFLCQFFKEQMLSVMPFADIVFGNESEAAAFAESNALGTTDVGEIALKIAGLYKANSKRPRMVIITQGKDPVVVAENGNITKYDATPLEDKDIVDTNGAGDAFVGGFLAQLVRGKSTEVCVRCGIWAATLVIQRSGCTFPENMDFKV